MMMMKANICCALTLFINFTKDTQSVEGRAKIKNPNLLTPSHGDFMS